MRPIERKHRSQMNAIMEALTQVFPGYGISLMVFELDKPGSPHTAGRINYISNAERASMLTALKEFIARSEGRFHDEPHGQQ